MQTTRRGVLAAAAGLAAGLRAGLGGGARAEPPVRGVVELFTSQGCSSCPPADRLLGELAADPSLVALSLPVDYWDGLGWKDTFAQHAFTERQRAYARVRGDGEIYTPQAVVDGTAIAVGSDRGGILSLLTEQLPVRVAILSEGGRAVAVIEGAPPDASLVIAPFLRARSVAIGRGENARARVTYSNIVRTLSVLGTVSGATRFRLPDIAEAEGIAVLVQEGRLDRPGRILGAAHT